ncbi:MULTISPECIES: hypothetical protein [Enterococcus]|uniref:Uncharacterized protein n=1 Tax=Enterococcus malodoratus ATCC 43197 TaxID=1158601 RepID=R2R971_9ENTE|nr:MULTISPECIES: hypothetical protein [Enterococcus]BBM19598.1 hypothetical protein G15_3278 [Enterococcus avium]EOH72509.1 hypothetical protein UAI_04094 [Enterococcus malodoratus ATCC 43197]EOT70165.1 hypothetical protein I585_01644 [Enterococcus malodoratus ATCC 43197]OJG66367.1 hypothetical protein RV07_GL000160 [Enterococcus malodoratus]SET85708.1 hypothetical protein SAMN04487821_12562 [Enterococcus malodoratus]
MDEQSNRIIPDEIKGWNWGAFMYNITWGIGNKSYLPLLCLIPLFNIIWIFVCGFKGNEWAWQKGDYEDIDTFLAVQKTWNRAGLVGFILFILLMVVYFLFFAAIITSIITSYHSYY